MEFDEANYTDGNQESPDNEEPELSHSDKIAGIFTEPANTFEAIAKHPVRTIDWLLPVLLLFLVLAVANVLLVKNPATKSDLKEKQRAKTQQSMDEAVKTGKITREQADQQMEKIESMDLGSPFMLIISFISIIIFGFVFFLIITGVYYLFVKYLLRGDGTYLGALVATGMSSYITIIQVLLATILALIMGRVLGDVSVGALLNVDKTTFLGMVLSKLDIISIWATIVMGIGFSRMFNSKETGKYLGLLFGLWIIWSLAVFFIGKSVPWVAMFQR